jgi:hypothetical protein
VDKPNVFSRRIYKAKPSIILNIFGKRWADKKRRFNKSKSHVDHFSEYSAAGRNGYPPQPPVMP